MRTSSPLAVLLLAALCLTGCATGTGARWYAPATWFSHRPADTVDKAEKREDAARDAVIKAAQRASHETALALQSAPASRPVTVASEFAAEAAGLLDQAAGTLDAATLARLRATVTGLLSENAAIRAEAERARAAEIASVADLSARLAKAQLASDAAAAKLREAFDRENALANELRSQRALAWIAGSVALLAAAGWIYLKFTIGGMPAAMGAAKKLLEAQHPDIAAKVGPIYARYLNRHEQAAISRFSK